MSLPISERLQASFKVAGFTLTDKPPNPKCMYAWSGKGCADDCFAIRLLDLQAIDGGLSDEELSQAAVQIASDAIRAGCTGLTAPEEKLVPPSPPGITL